LTAYYERRGEQKEREISHVHRIFFCSLFTGLGEVMLPL
jgi:hypothetical protein